MPTPEQLHLNRGRVEAPLIGQLQTALEPFTKALPQSPFTQELALRLADPQAQFTRIDEKDARRDHRQISYYYLELGDGRGIMFTYNPEAADKTFYYRKTATMQHPQNAHYILPKGINIENLDQLATPPTLTITLTTRTSDTAIIEDTSAHLSIVRDREDVKDPGQTKPFSIYTTTAKFLDSTQTHPLSMDPLETQIALTTTIDTLNQLDQQRIAYLTQQATTLKHDMQRAAAVDELTGIYTYIQNHPDIFQTDGFRALFHIGILSRSTNRLTKQELRILQAVAQHPTATGKEIGELVDNLAPSTVSQHRIRLASKLRFILSLVS